MIYKDCEIISLQPHSPRHLSKDSRSPASLRRDFHSSLTKAQAELLLSAVENATSLRVKAVASSTAGSGLLTGSSRSKGGLVVQSFGKLCSSGSPFLCAISKRFSTEFLGVSILLTVSAIKVSAWKRTAFPQWKCRFLYWQCRTSVSHRGLGFAIWNIIRELCHSAFSSKLCFSMGLLTGVSLCEQR